VTAGVLVISFDYKCGPKEILIDNSGIIIESHDKQTFCNAIIELIENNVLRKNIVVNSKDVSKKFNK
jgi:glycosyltransferase involved in cell wall biosynthesis